MSRKTLKHGGHDAVFGVRGARVRVLEEKLADGRKRVVALWYVNSKPKKRTFHATPAGRIEAVSWAMGFAEALANPAPPADAPPPPLAIGRMFEMFAEATFEDLAEATQRNYRFHWNKWEMSWGRTFPAEQTTLKMLLDFRSQERRLSRASNQVRQSLNVVRIVYNWAALHDLIAVNKVALHRWKRSKKEQKIQPGEYTREEYEKILLALDPQLGTEWRPHVLCALIAQHGVRIRSALHLRWTDVGNDAVTWPAKFMKTGEPLEQPVTWETWAALETARYWHRRLRLDSPWVFPGTRRSGGKPYTYGAAHAALMKAEKRAGVVHEKWRAFHGGRRMVAGNIADETGDARLGMEYIGDKDMKQANSYLKRRSERIDRAAAVLSGASPKPSPNRTPTARRKGSIQGPSVSGDVVGASEGGKEPLVGFEPTTASQSRPLGEREIQQDNELAIPNGGGIPPTTSIPLPETLPATVPGPRVAPDALGGEE